MHLTAEDADHLKILVYPFEYLQVISFKIFSSSILMAYKKFLFCSVSNNYQYHFLNVNLYYIFFSFTPTIPSPHTTHPESHPTGQHLQQPHHLQNFSYPHYKAEV